LAILKQGCERRGAGAFGDLMRVVEVNPHCFRDFVFADLHETGNAAADDLDGLVIGFAGGESVGEGIRIGGFERAPGCKGLGSGRRLDGADSDDLGL
jgi:hypothetical protein